MFAVDSWLVSIRQVEISTYWEDYHRLLFSSVHGGRVTSVPRSHTQPMPLQDPTKTVDKQNLEEGPHQGGPMFQVPHPQEILSDLLGLATKRLMLPYVAVRVNTVLCKESHSMDSCQTA